MDEKDKKTNSEELKPIREALDRNKETLEAQKKKLDELNERNKKLDAFVESAKNALAEGTKEESERTLQESREKAKMTEESARYRDQRVGEETPAATPRNDDLSAEDPAATTDIGKKETFRRMKNERIRRIKKSE